MRIPLPEFMRDQVNSVGEPAAARDAATIVLARDGDDGLETYLLRRQPQMEFAPGMYVFPGGSVQPSDAAPLPWVGPGPQEWAQRFGCDPGLAGALVVAAVRETFEESGILLAGPDAETVVADVSSPEFAAARVALDAGEYGFAEFLAEHDLVMRADLVGPWAHWITPEFERRRFDTRFLVAALPEGQVVGSLPGEADRAAWVPVSRALEAVRAGEAAMLPPTAVALAEVAALSAAELVPASRERRIVPILPRIVDEDGQLFIENSVEVPW